MFRSSIAGLLYIVLNFATDVILHKTVTIAGGIELALEGILFTIFLMWLLNNATSKSKVNAGNTSDVKCFLLGMIGSWVILTASLFIQLGDRINEILSLKPVILIGIYLFVGIICGFAFYLSFRIKAK